MYTTLLCNATNSSITDARYEQFETNRYWWVFVTIVRYQYPLQDAATLDVDPLEIFGLDLDQA